MEHVVSYKIKAVDEITPVQEKAIANNKRTQDAFGKTANKVDQTNASARRLDFTLGKVGKHGIKVPQSLTAGFGKLASFLNGPMLAAVAGAFGVQKVIQFGGSVVNTLANFERFDAVLTNTLGSGSAAQKVMKDIVDLASSTPFEVDSLTDAWVRLANQGFKPNMKELVSLGDLASSTGKDITMLSEAIIDAQVGENERLKEFGIKAEQSGRKTIFTFKGIKTVVDRNATAIQKYLVSLGNIKGVQGAMNAISKTTGGLLSNLSDKYTQLKLTIGKGLKPVISGVIEFLGKLIDIFEKKAEWLLKNEALVKRYTVNALTKLWQFLLKVGDAIGMMIKFWDENGKTIMEFADIVGKVIVPVILIIMKLGSVIMKVYYILDSTLIKLWKFVYDVGVSIVSLIGTIKGGFDSFFNWMEEKIGFLADVLKYTLILPLLPFIAIVKGVKRIIHGGEKVQRAELPSGQSLIPSMMGNQADAPGVKAPAFDDRLLNLPGNKILQVTGIIPKTPDQGIMKPPSEDIYGSPASGPDKDTGKGKKISDRATDVSGVKSGEIKNITINVDKLVETFNIVTEKLGMSEGKVKSYFTQLMLDALNDTQRSY